MVGIGFTLPINSITIRGHRMDLSAHPWGPSGTSLTPNPHTNPSAWESFVRKHNARYGTPHTPDYDIIDFPGLHHTDFESALEQIAARNPDWFRQFGMTPTGGTVPTREEVFDAQAVSWRDRIIQEGKRLFELDSPPEHPEPVPTQVGPEQRIEETLAQRVRPLMPALSPLSVRVDELRNDLYQIVPESVDYLFSPRGRWNMFRPFAIELLHVWRLLRRHLGDPRPLPGKE